MPLCAHLTRCHVVFTCRVFVLLLALRPQWCSKDIPDPANSTWAKKYPIVEVRVKLWWPVDGVLVTGTSKCPIVVTGKPRCLDPVNKLLIIAGYHLSHSPPCIVIFWSLCVHAYSVVSNSLQLHGLQPVRLLCPWDFLGRNVGNFLLHGIFPTQGSNHISCIVRRILLSLSHLGSPWSLWPRVKTQSFPFLSMHDVPLLTSAYFKKRFKKQVYLVSTGSSKFKSTEAFTVTLPVLCEFRADK